MKTWRTQPAFLAMQKALVVFALMILTSCSTVMLISDYDAETDKQLSTLQQSTDIFISRMTAEIPKWERTKRSEKNAYDAQKKFYSEFDDKLRLLEFRVQSIPKNSKTQKLVADIRAAVLLPDNLQKQCEQEGLVIKEGEETQFNSLQSMHCLQENKAAGPSRMALEISQRNINQVIGAALALEVAKKQGTEVNK
jgi:hypothetical protein